MNLVFQEDLEHILQADFIPWERLSGKNILVTGGTGLIGFHLICSLLYADRKLGLGIHILAPVRDREKAEWMYRKAGAEENLRFLVGSVEELPSIPGAVDYIVHGAGITDSKKMVSHPAETIWTTVQGTRTMLEVAKEKGTARMVFLSSMEVYGNQQSEKPLGEEADVCLAPGNLRDCYPISKALAESLCLSYGKEYGVAASCLRLSQTLGCLEQREKKKERKIIQEILDDIREGMDIRLLTKGESKRTYLYIRDAITAILAVLLDQGNPGIFNAANEDSYSSVYELCEMAAHEVAKDRIRVLVEGRELPQYPKTNFLNLSSAKLRQIGWKPSVPLKDMLERMLEWGDES